MLTLAGGKGINVARALKRLDVPVVATGLAGGRTGTRIVEELTAEAILNDFVRIKEESRTSTAVVDPTTRHYTEINEWGPRVSPGELEMLLEKLQLPLPRRRLRRLRRLAAALPSRRASTPRRSATSTAAASPVVLDTEAAPLRFGTEAEPELVSPNQHEAEELVGQELEDDEDFLMALDAIADMGARNVQITTRRRLLRARSRGPPRAPLPRRGARARAGLGRRCRRRAARAVPRGSARGRPVEEALRLAVAAGAASVLEVGAGRFEPREAARLAAAVRVDELAAVSSS